MPHQPLPLPAPPPESDPPGEPTNPDLEHAGGRLRPLHVLTAVAVAAIVLGAAWASWERAIVVKRVELDRVSTTAASNLAAATEAQSYQLHALQVDAQSVRERLVRVEANLNAVDDDLKFLRAQLIEIARATGARAVKETP